MKISPKLFASILFFMFLQTTYAKAQSCSFSVSNMNFGVVNLLSGNSNDTSAVLSYNCSNLLMFGLSLRICPNLSMGSGGGSSSARYMVSGTNALSYQLFQDSGNSVPWGAVSDPSLGSVPAIDIFLPPFSSRSGSINIYGRILARQASAPAGSYVSSFNGMHANFTYQQYTLFAPACESVAANSAQASFNVSAQIQKSCTITATTLNFGNHGMLTANIDATSTLFVNCTANLPYTIALNGGMSNMQPHQRRMTNNANVIIYGLYSNSSRTIAWGETPGQIVSETGSGTTQDITVYGRVLPQTTPPPGIYTDIVVATVTY